MADFKIGDRLMYGTVGLVEIIDIRVENAFGADREYYILREQDSASDAQIFVPKDNEALAANMRPLLSEKEINRLLSLEERAPIEWNKDNRLIVSEFSCVLNKSCEQMREILSKI